MVSSPGAIKSLNHVLFLSKSCLGEFGKYLTYLQLNWHFSFQHHSCRTSFLCGFPKAKQCFPARATLPSTTSWIWASWVFTVM